MFVVVVGEGGKRGERRLAHAGINMMADRLILATGSTHLFERRGRAVHRRNVAVHFGLTSPHGVNDTKIARYYCAVRKILTETTITK